MTFRIAVRGAVFVALILVACLSTVGAAMGATSVRAWGNSGVGDGQFSGAQFLAVDQAGDVYVTDSNNKRVEKFSPTGQFLTKWAVPGSGSPNNVNGIAVDKDG